MAGFTPAPTREGTDTSATKPSNGVAYTMGICAWYICISAVLINFNKYLMHKDRFPHATPLTTLHVTVTFIVCSCMYMVKPELFPSMTEALSKRMQLFKYFVPVSVLFLIGVICSNNAYLYCNVAFLQFMKEWNIALVFILSCISGSMTCNRVRFFVIMWIVAAACAAVTGDMNFSRLGFLIQVCSQLGETSRIVIQEKLLSGNDCRLDALTYQIFVGPPTLMTLTIANYVFWNPAVIEAIQVWWPYLLLNATCAVFLNITISLLIKKAGGVAFVLAGVVKDIVIVTTSSYFAGKSLNTQEILGFSLACWGIMSWGMLKVNAQHPLVSWIPKLLRAQPEDDEASEKKPLLNDKLEKGALNDKIVKV